MISSSAFLFRKDNKEIIQLNNMQKESYENLSPPKISLKEKEAKEM